MSIDSSGNVTVSTGSYISTRANNTADGGGQIYLNGATGNRIDFNTNGVGAPAFTTRSVGTRIVLYPFIGAAVTDFAFGIEGGTLWSSVPSSASQFKWYAGTTNIATLSGAGVLTATLSGNASTATNLTSNGTDWSSNGRITAVVGALGWKNYGDNHTIFDASNSTAPNYGASPNKSISNTDSEVAWTGTYPTLMGWNGTNTYGVRVDRARLADNGLKYINSYSLSGGTYTISGLNLNPYYFLYMIFIGVSVSNANNTRVCMGTAIPATRDSLPIMAHTASATTSNRAFVFQDLNTGVGISTADWLSDNQTSAAYNKIYGITNATTTFYIFTADSRYVLDAGTVYLYGYAK
jgi:hypothetical protein